MLLSDLHAIELQLVMQYCDQSSWLRLARCSRFTLQAATAPLARQHFTLQLPFRHPYTLPPKRGVWAAVKRALSTRASVPSLAERLQRSALLRHCELLLSWDTCDTYGNASEVDALLPSGVSLQFVTVAKLSAWNLSLIHI